MKERFGSFVTARDDDQANDTGLIQIDLLNLE